MKLRDHILLGGAVSAGLYPVVGAQSVVFWGGSVLLDVDHYWHYLYYTGYKDFSVKRMFAFHALLFRSIHRPDFLGLNTCHTAEFFLAVYLTAIQLNSALLMVTLWGMLFHLFLDVVFLIWHAATFKRALSIMEYWIRKKRMMRHGFYPQVVFEEAIDELALGADWEDSCLRKSCISPTTPILAPSGSEAAIARVSQPNRSQSQSY